MALPLIEQQDGVLGFSWRLPDGTPATLTEVIALPEAEAHRWLPTHLEALDDVLIEVASRWGEVLGGARRPTTDETSDVIEAYEVVDRLCVEYAAAWHAAGLAADLRAGQIVGTAALMSIRLRESVGRMGPAPFDGELDTPGPGVVGGRAALCPVDERMPWLGGRWLVIADDGRRLPATLSMLLFDSSGVDKDAVLTEHADLLRRTVAAASSLGVEPLETSGAIDWLLFDWVMAHRDSPDSGAVQIKSGKTDDAVMVVDAAAASVAVRARMQP